MARLRRLLLRVALVAFVARVASVAGTDAPLNTTAPDGSPLSPWLTCMRVNSVSSDVCDVQSVCSRCVRTSGCAFDVLVRECVALPDDGRALYASSSNALLNRTNLQYCRDGDAQCASCVVSSSTPFCEGTDACVCPSLCATLRPTQLACYAIQQSNMMYISVAVMALALPVLVWLHRFCTQLRRGRNGQGHNDVRTELRRMREQRHVELARARQRPHQSSALALQLDTWRSHRDEHKVEIDKVAPLRTCYVLMENDAPPAVHDGGSSRDNDDSLGSERRGDHEATGTSSASASGVNATPVAVTEGTVSAPRVPETSEVTASRA